MTGWLIARPYEVNAGIPTHEALFAVWNADQETALRKAQSYSPRGSSVTSYVVAGLSEGMLRGLRLQPGETGILHADQPHI